MHVTKPASRVLEQLPDEFTYNDLNKRINEPFSQIPDFECNYEAIKIIYWFADSNYENKIPHRITRISERVIFPVSEK